ncbi:centromere protein H (CENP-H)-domain-containing protein [Mariannaea sp. PMI_226]|nr:centromere protein H (CENP-H)-domain-containing protein [Mariannaea sp. PMI_226]
MAMEEPIEKLFSNDFESEIHVPFSEDEERAIALYDRLQELRLEIAIINAQRLHRRDNISDLTQEQTQQEQTELLKARANYVLRNNVVEAVMAANPILKAVHHGTDSSSVDTDLLPYIEKRDETTISVAKQVAASEKQLKELTSIQSETLRVSRQNVILAAELLKIAEEVKEKKTGHSNNLEATNEQEALRAKVKDSRQRWKMMKGVVSGMIVGSGVDWAADDELRETVLDPESED